MKKPTDTNSLDYLLHLAIEHQRKNKKLLADLTLIKIHQEVQSTYGNPRNWRPGALVELLHRSDTGEVTSLGIFQESFYRGTSDRRLQRSDSTVSDRTEWVSGRYWTEPCPTPFHQFEETPLELEQLQQRFDELLSQIIEEYQL